MLPELSTDYRKHGKKKNQEKQIRTHLDAGKYSGSTSLITEQPGNFWFGGKLRCM